MPAPHTLDRRPIRALRRRLARACAGLAGLGLGLAVGLAAATGPARADYFNYGDDLCLNQTRLKEQVSDIPAHVLTAISLVESGRWDSDRQARVAWPWTVTNGGSGKFFRTKAEAIAHVRALQERGEWNIDVGCMQINLHYHGDAFDSLEKAFEPRANVEYAAKFLTDLYRETGSWTRAVSRYHSATPHLAERYMGKFRTAWQEAQDYAVVAGLPPVRDIVGEAERVEAAYQAERARAEAELEAQRAAAREAAEAWRAEKLRAWRERREARAETEDGGDAGNAS
jgi:hypothetical protein